jgi:hypothetical protein
MKTSMLGRVAGLGAFSPIGQSFYSGQFFVNYRSRPNFEGTFFHSEILQTKNGWSTFWAIFTQTHLVTLMLHRYDFFGFARKRHYLKKVKMRNRRKFYLRTYVCRYSFIPAAPDIECNSIYLAFSNLETFNFTATTPAL